MTWLDAYLIGQEHEAGQAWNRMVREVATKAWEEGWDAGKSDLDAAHRWKPGDGIQITSNPYKDKP